jgi:hypothetical protein
MEFFKGICKLLFYFSFIFLSCKKDRVCECSVKSEGTSTTTAQITAEIAPPPFPPVVLFDTSFTTVFLETDIRKIKFYKTTKRQAKNNCVSYEEPFKESNYNSVPNFSLITTKEGKRTYNCTLK